MVNGCRPTFVVSAKDASQPGTRGFTCDIVAVHDATRIEDVVQGLTRASVDVRDFDFVCTEHEEAIVPASVLAAAYGRPGLPVPTAVALRDKCVQKRLVRTAGIPVAQCETVLKAETLRARAASAPFVIKPLDGAGAQLTYAVQDQRSLDNALRSIASSGRHGPWLVEEFINGTELHLDGVVRSGMISFLSVSRYLQNIISIRSGGAGSSDH